MGKQQHQEHFEYDRVGQSETTSKEDEDGAIDRRKVSLTDARSLTPRIVIAAVCAALLLAWGVSDRGGEAPEEEAPDAGTVIPLPPDHVGPAQEQEGSKSTNISSPDVSGMVDGGDEEESSAAQPVFVTQTTVKELHGKIPKSFYDPRDEDVSPSGGQRKTCALLGKERGYVCIGDRVGNGERLARGTALCSHRGRYMFGMDERGSLVWRDCFEDEERVYYESTTAGTGNATTGGEYFVMREDASFVVNDADGETNWERGCKFEVHLTPRCLSKPTYDCPYLHLHSEGVLVLNWIEEGGRWMSKGVNKLYSF